MHAFSRSLCQAVNQLQEQLKKKTEQRRVGWLTGKFQHSLSISHCEQLKQDAIYQEIQPCQPESEGTDGWKMLLMSI